MNKIIIAALIIFSSLAAKSQLLEGDVGLFLGTSYYIGEVNHSKQFYSPGVALGIFWRKNFNDHYSLKIAAYRDNLSGTDTDFDNVYQQTRNYSFSNNIYSLSIMPEFNFIEYNNINIKSLSPYITAGVSLLVMPASKQILGVTVPFGVGFKYALTRKLTIGAEWIFYETFTDDLDLMETNDIASKSFKQNTNVNNYDWYSHGGIIISYSFTNEKHRCRAYGNIKSK